MRQVKIPRYIDSPLQFFFWEIDEFLIIAASFGAGIWFGGWYTLMSLPLGIYLSKVFKRYKANGLPGQLNHLAHWFNILNVNKAFKRGGNRRLFK